MISACSPGKIILFGEHAVVYNRPALAVPVNSLKACVHIEPSHGDPDGTIWINAPALGFRKSINAMAVENPLAQSCRLTLELLQKRTFPSFEITIKSSIPTASGMGSGAAVTIAIIRAVARYFDSMIADKDVNNIAFEVEKIYHGTPSGIDNTVITYNRPVFFIRDITMEPFSIKQPFNLLLPTPASILRLQKL
jgi:mevalonate kinase